MVVRLTAALARESWDSYTKVSKGRDQVGPSGTCCRRNGVRGRLEGNLRFLQDRQYLFTVTPNGASEKKTDAEV